jgi:branched-subunit amino acid transport protein AzlD
MNNLHIALTIAIIAAVTAALRFAPFLIFGGKRNVPKLIEDLSNALPAAIMGMLIVYCLRNVDIMSGSHGFPELIAIVVVAALHIWKKNTILSIATGTVVYMILIQTLFA